ncbi:hypothetical protein Pyn_12723 [Prunus yedoensis var. nudiflora]|uniref:BRCT domain-containing protein n=1 Tax=Prunus yedoensis var. nudiflora TaxID=2094558 RepID=A0A314UJK9_PRUYE|nr:hypothetical protein Pyn_12723 [Prunus yedoensis var. nudiflora]
MLKTTTFKGANVFMSRNLVPPEIFDALPDALKLNGANVFLCCDPSRTGPDDYHVIASSDHEKFEDLRAKGCNLLGPQCVFSCANQHRALPKQGFTCCLAMDGFKVLASGFEGDEKVKIEKLVTAMGGVLHAKACLDVNFVIVKNVLAGKYKAITELVLFMQWALNTLKKPIVTINWLSQCWNEHRNVPQDSFRVLPFSGLMISVTRIPADERKEIEKLITENEGDKYKVAQRWGHIRIVTRKWFDQSISRRACLNEDSYPVQGGSISSNKSVRGCFTLQNSQRSSSGNLQSVPPSVVADSNLTAAPCSGTMDSDLEATVSQNITTTFSHAPHVMKNEDSKAPPLESKSEAYLDGCVADDSQSEDNDLYLSECRISLVGFKASEMRRLVNMIRRGGGSRYMSFNDKLTHIVVGTPSEIEKKEVRGFAALGVIHVVRTTWLEDCDREKKETPVLPKHIAYDLVLPEGALIGMTSTIQGTISTTHLSIPSDQLHGNTSAATGMGSLEKKREKKPEINMKGSVKQYNCGRLMMEYDSSVQNGKESSVFKGRLFCFSNSFPEDRRGDIIQWVNQGGGDVVDGHLKQKVHFTIECHGVITSSVDVAQTTYVSSHWIRSCLEDGCLLDVSSHILYAPLPCRIPLPGFENFRFCVSQYEEKDRLLLRNLCFVLGAKFGEKLTKKVTHLLCKFTNGPKYQAACTKGIHPITAEWVYECVKKNKVVALDQFYPKKVTAEDREAGLCTMSQYPTQAVQMISAGNSSECPSQSQDLRTSSGENIGSRNDSLREEASEPSFCNKKARVSEDDGEKVSQVVPDVASAIEDLLEQTSKIHDQKSPGRSLCDSSIFSPDCSALRQDHSDSHSVIGLSRHWLNRAGKKDDIHDPSGEQKAGLYDGFSETQTESQVVGYEEDLTGRQMLIDRVRTRSSLA